MMSNRLSILELTVRHRLDTATLLSLRQIARLDQPPASLMSGLRRGIGYVAALFAGLGLIFVIAANWNSLGRIGQFGLLEAFVATTCFGAAALPQARQPLALLGLLSVGGLFAYFGQTYQTGADAWQLFALWSVISLPLALGARSDVVWTAWVIVAMTAVGTWDGAQSGMWRLSHHDLDTHAIASLMAVGLAFIVCAPVRPHTGAGVWSFNVAVLFAATMTAMVGTLGLFGNHSLYYLVSICAFAATAALLRHRSAFDITTLSIVALGLNFLLVSGVAELMLSGTRNFIGALLVVGLVAAGMLSVTVWAILSLTRQYGGIGASNE